MRQKRHQGIMNKNLSAIAFTTKLQIKFTANTQNAGKNSQVFSVFPLN